MLSIEFFRYALQLQYTSALDLLYLAVGILLVSGALYLGTKRERRRRNRETNLANLPAHQHRTVRDAHHEIRDPAHQRHFKRKRFGQ